MEGLERWTTDTVSFWMICIRFWKQRIAAYPSFGSEGKMKSVVVSKNGQILGEKLCTYKQ